MDHVKIAENLLFFMDLVKILETEFRIQNMQIFKNYFDCFHQNEKVTETKLYVYTDNAKFRKKQQQLFPIL
jgi:N-acetyl-gamma-glutamylphosphate reductase